MTIVCEAPARLKVRKLVLAADSAITAVVLGWWLMAATGHSDGDLGVLTVCVVVCTVLTVIAWLRLRPAMPRVCSSPSEPSSGSLDDSRRGGAGSCVGAGASPVTGSARPSELERTLFAGDIDDEEFETFQQAHLRRLRFFKSSPRYAGEVARLESLGPPPPMQADGAIGRILYYEYHRPTRDEIAATLVMMQAENLISAQEADIERATLDADPSADVVARLKSLADRNRPR